MCACVRGWCDVMCVVCTDLVLELLAELAHARMQLLVLAQQKLVLLADESLFVLLHRRAQVRPMDDVWVRACGW